MQGGEEIKRENLSYIEDPSLPPSLLPSLPKSLLPLSFSPASQQTDAELVWGDKSSHRNNTEEKCHRPWSSMIYLAQVLTKLRSLWCANNDTILEERSTLLEHFKSYPKQLQLGLDPAFSSASQNFVSILYLICSLCILIWADFISAVCCLHYPRRRLIWAHLSYVHILNPLWKDISMTNSTSIC